MIRTLKQVGATTGMTTQTIERAPTCTLNDEQYNVRRSEIRDQLWRCVTRIEEIESGIQLIFARSPDLGKLLATFVSLEKQCCGFLSFAISDEGESTVLSMTGPPEAKSGLLGFAERINAND